MKQCPQCNRTYADKSIAFCLADGVLLSAPYDPDATQRIPVQSIPLKVDQAALAGQDNVTDNMHIPPSPTTKGKAKTNLLYFVVPAIGLLLFVIIGGIYWPFKTTPGYGTNAPPVTNTAPSATSDVLLIPFRKGDKFGFSDANKNLIIEARYDFAEPFSERLARVWHGDNSAFIDKTRNEVTTFKPDTRPSDRDIFSLGSMVCLHNWADKENKDGQKDGIALVEREGKCGFIDKASNKVTEFEYDSARTFSEGLAAVQKGNYHKWGYIDKTGKLVIPLKYDLALWFKNGLAKVKRDDKIFYIDKNGTEYYEP